jgi:hypothetical protein
VGLEPEVTLLVAFREVAREVSAVDSDLGGLLRAVPVLLEDDRVVLAADGDLADLAGREFLARLGVDVGDAAETVSSKGMAPPW